MKKSIYIIVLFSLLTSTSLPIHAQGKAQGCYTYINTSVEMAQEKKLFDENINSLMKSPDISTSKLSETGVEYMRLYHAKLITICNKIITQNNKGCTKSQEEQQGDLQSCLIKMDNELATQKTVFTQFMIGDAGQKKTQFIVNKYKELNKKFMALVDTIIAIKEGLRKLLFNIGKESTSTQAPEK